MALVPYTPVPSSGNCRYYTTDQPEPPNTYNLEQFLSKVSDGGYEVASDDFVSVWNRGKEGPITSSQLITSLGRIYIQLYRRYKATDRNNTTV